MKNVQKAFFTFWQQFGLPVYLEGQTLIFDEQGNAQVPPLPYITFSFSRDDFFANNIATGQVWTQDTSFASVLEVLEEIEKAVPAGGANLILDDGEGMIRLYRGTPFIQYQPSDDQTLKVGYINLETISYVI